MEEEKIRISRDDVINKYLFKNVVEGIKLAKKHLQNEHK